MHKVNWEENKEHLMQLLIAENKSFENVGRMFGVTGKAIRKACDRLQIPIPRRRTINENETFGRGIRRLPTVVCINCNKEFQKTSASKGKFCSKKCEGQYKKRKGYERILNGDQSIMKASFNIGRYRNILLEEQKNKCALCGMTPYWRDKPLVFIIDHIDGHASNNKRSNLRLICPNCDSQLDTYKNKNKNSDRIYYHLNQRR